ncbi:MAG: hypothetical protein ACRD8Z_07160 [Nitrososphaeraceae archaeon]
MRIGSYEIPEIRFNSGAFSDIKKIYDNVKSVDRQIHANDLALLLGYKTPTSGGFYRRINSLISYGLLEGRGKFRVTKNGEDLLYPRDDDHRKQLLRESVLRISLWNEFYKKFKRELPDNLWLEIKDLTGVSSAEAQSVEKEVRRWYLNDTEQIAGEISLLPPSEKLREGLDSKRSEDIHKNPSYQSIQTIGYIETEEIPFAGKYAIRKPANEDIRKSWENLKKYMDIYLEDFNEESSDTGVDRETSDTNLK